MAKGRGLVMMVKDVVGLLVKLANRWHLSHALAKLKASLLKVGQ